MRCDISVFYSSVRLRNVRTIMVPSNFCWGGVEQRAYDALIVVKVGIGVLTRKGSSAGMRLTVQQTTNGNNL